MSTLKKIGFYSNDEETQKVVERRVRAYARRVAASIAADATNDATAQEKAHAAVVNAEAILIDYNTKGIAVTTHRDRLAEVAKLVGEKAAAKYLD